MNQRLIRPSQVESHEHIQTIAATEWVVVHNLHKIPNTVIRDYQGDIVYTKVDVIDEDTIKLIFSTPMVGEVKCT